MHYSFTRRLVRCKAAQLLTVLPFVAAFLLASTARAQATLVHYDPVGNANETNLSPASVAAGLTASPLQLVGATPGSFSGSFHALGWTHGGSPDLARYVEFSVTGSFEAGFIQHHWFNTSFGPKRVTVRSSLDNYATDIATSSYTGNVSLDIRCLGSLTGTVTFRLYFHEGSGGPDATTNAIFIDGSAYGQQGIRLVSPAVPLLGTDSCPFATVLASSPSQNVTGQIVSDHSGNGASAGFGDDWFEYTIPATSDLVIDATFDGTAANVDLELVDSCSTVISSSTGTGNTEQLTLSNALATPRTVQVRVFVSAPIGGCTPYDLVITETFNPCLLDDVYEPNNTCDTGPLVAENSMLNSLRSITGQEDWYTINVPAGSTQTVEIAFANPSDSAVLSVRDTCVPGSAGTLALFLTTDGLGSFSFTNMGLTTSTYNVATMFLGAAGTCADYTLTLTNVGPPTGISHCFGDAGDQMGCTSCPCINNAAQGTIGGCLNSAGTSARLEASGDPSVSLPPGDTTDLRFEISGVPGNAFCILNSGDALAPGNMANPCFGLNSGAQAVAFDGLRCAITNTRRHGGRSANVNGDIGTNGAGSPWGGEGGPPVGIANAGAGFVSGQTRFFQVINRDDALLGCMRGLNTSQAVEVTFTP